MATTSLVPNTKLPPYLPFATFQAAIQSLRVHGVPDKLDRTAWDSRSGADRLLIIAALKFFGLMDEQENPQPILRKLTSVPENSEQEKVILKQLIEYSYSDVFKYNLATATIAMLKQAIEGMGVTSSTRDRSVRFFIKAAHHCGIALSGRLTKGLRSRSESDSSKTADEGEESNPAIPRAKRRRKTLNANGDRMENPPPSGMAVRTVPLRNGGELTLSGTFNPFDLDGEDRKLVYDIIDLMKAYETK
jgi:hypothetical protein